MIQVGEGAPPLRCFGPAAHIIRASVVHDAFFECRTMRAANGKNGHHRECDGCVILDKT